MYDDAAPFALGLLIGGMAFFSFVIAPMSFRLLPAEAAGRFVRGIFPHYYLFVIVASAASLVALIGPAPALAKVFAGVLILGVVARQVLMPAINRFRDRALAGDVKAKRWFGALHGLSVGVNFVQLGAAIVCFALYV